MRNVTISLDSDLAQWVRVEAAKADKSVSRWIADVLEAKRAAADDRTRAYHAAIDHFLAHPGYELEQPGTGARGRDAMDEELWRERFSRFDHDDLRGRSYGGGEASPRLGVAEPPTRIEDGDDQPSGDQ